MYARPCPLGFGSPMPSYVDHVHVYMLPMLTVSIIVQVVFKALIVLHTMIRNGATDNVLSYLSSSEVLRLRNVAAVNWEGASCSILPLSSPYWSWFLHSIYLFR